MLGPRCVYVQSVDIENMPLRKLNRVLILCFIFTNECVVKQIQYIQELSLNLKLIDYMQRKKERSL